MAIDVMKLVRNRIQFNSIVSHILQRIIEKVVSTPNPSQPNLSLRMKKKKKDLFNKIIKKYFCAFRVKLQNENKILIDLKIKKEFARKGT